MTGYSERPAPREASELIGHELAERTFLDAWNSGRMHHAWLITGPQGIGKATLAYRIARFVLAQSGEKGQGSGLFGEAAPPDSLALPPEHPVSRRVASSGHADLLSIERSVNPKTGKPRSEILVEDVRRLGGFLSLTTAESAWRAVVVDVADEMNRSAANALLKGLEEPPARTLFLLVSHMPGRLLPTIRSRCRAITLQPLETDFVAGLLRRFSPDMDAGDAATLAGMAEGSIGRALTLADNGGLDLYRELVRLLSGLDRLDVPGVHALGDKVGRPGAEENFGLLGSLLDNWLAAMIRGQARGEAVPEIVPGEAAAGQKLQSRGGLAKWLEVWENVTRLFSQAGSVNLDRKQVVVSAFLALEEAARG